MPDLLTLYRLSQCRIPALIALMAILMLFIAPEISKTLEHRRMQSDGEVMTEPSSEAMDGMDMAMMPMDHAMDHPMANADHQVMAEQSDESTAKTASHLMNGGMGMMDDFACGYCQLLAHFPVLAWVLIPLISLLLLSSRASPSLLSSVTPVTFFPGISQPRAPPAF
ncbi:DUF2946 domain-containing protein [Pantoea sp. B65]|uniref:DUF2946 domain-containing protein n=1 Tax=Pantoea sp. B65 TaxID=2813359 RepID=UPI0039B6DD02